MDHSEALRLKACERYLLDEFPDDLKEQFEEHFFGCQECAADLRLGATFIEQAKKVLAAPSPPLAVPVAKSKSRGLAFKWRIATGVAFAFLLVAIGYQQFVVRPQLSRQVAALRNPQVLPSIYLSNGTSRGDNIPKISVRPEQTFIMFVDIPADSRFTEYNAVLIDPAGTQVWSLPISAATVESSKDTLPIRVAPLGDHPGNYQLIVKATAVASEAQSVVGRYQLEVTTR